jgi:hypothetical protein
MATTTFRFSPGASLFPGPKFSPSVKTWVLTFDRFVISAVTDRDDDGPEVATDPEDAEDPLRRTV